MADDVPELINSDEKRFKQVLFNLIGNSAKFTFKGFIRLTVRQVNQYIETSVEDTGIGMDHEELKKLFQYFGKLKTSKGINEGGLGLGLTISKMIVEQLQGNITVESQKGQGSIFTFRILADNFQ